MRRCCWVGTAVLLLWVGMVSSLMAEDPPYLSARIARADNLSGHPFHGPRPSPSAFPMVAAQATPLFSQDSDPALTLAELEALALEHNPTMVQSRMAVQAAQGRLVQAGLYPNPVVGYSADDLGAVGTAGKQGGFVLQEIVTGKKRGLDRSIAGHEVAEAEAACRAQQARVLNDVRTSFYDVLLAQQVVELNTQLLRLSEESVKATDQLYQAKEASRVDLLQAQIQSDEARLKLHSSNNRHWAAWRRLALAMGLPDMSPRTLAGDPAKDLPKITWSDALAQLLSQSPELAHARASMERARCALAREYAQRIPNVEMRAAVQHDNTLSQTITNVEVGVPLPLFNRNQGNICRAQAELIAAQSEIERVELDLHERLVGVFQRYADARHSADVHSASILPNAKSSLDLVAAGYRQGELNYHALLTAQQTYANVSLAYLESLRELRESSISIEGFLLSGALQGGNSQPPTTVPNRGPLTIGMKD